MAENKEVLLIGRAELDSIHQHLSKMQAHAIEGLKDVSGAAKRIDDALANNAKKNENNIKNTGKVLRRLASTLYSDFKALLSLNALQGALKLSSQFKNAIGDSITLSDTIRRLGGSFGLARKDFGAFQGQLSRGLGDIGASSEAAAAALEGLTGLGIKGAASTQGMVKGAVTLAGLSGEKGNEKAVAGLLGSTLRGQGKDVNDAAAQKALIGEVTAAVQATGKKSSEILGAMDQIFSTMDKKLRGNIGPDAMAQMATIAATVGPSATKAMQEYLSKSQIERLPMEQQGVNFFGKNGQIDMKELVKFIKTSQQRIGMDPRKALQTFGFSEEAAEGLVRIGQQSDAVQSSLEKLASASRDNEKVFKDNMGLMEAFQGSINTLKGRFEELTGGVTKKATDILSNQVGHVGGAAAVVGGGALAAAVLAGGGLRGLLGGLAKKKATEEITGKEVQDVYVVNASEIGGGVAGEGLAAAGGGMMGKLGKGAAVLGAGAVGYEVGEQLVNPALDKYTQGKTSEGFEGNAVERLFFKLDKLLGGESSKSIINANQKMKVTIDTKEPNLRSSQKPGRGASN